MVRTWTLTKTLMDPRPRAQLADAVQEAPVSARGLTDGLKVNPVSVTKHGWRTLLIKWLVLFKGEWLRPWCFQGGCYTAQKYADCEDKENNHLLGDGTKCFGGRRSTRCPTGT